MITPPPHVRRQEEYNSQNKAAGIDSATVSSCNNMLERRTRSRKAPCDAYIPESNKHEGLIVAEDHQDEDETIATPLGAERRFRRADRIGDSVSFGNHRFCFFEVLFVVFFD